MCLFFLINFICFNMNTKTKPNKAVTFLNESWLCYCSPLNTPSICKVLMAGLY